MTTNNLTPIQWAEIRIALATMLSPSEKTMADRAVLLAKLNASEQPQTEREWTIIRSALLYQLDNPTIRLDNVWASDIHTALDYVTRKAYAMDWPHHNLDAWLEGACDDAI